MASVSAKASWLSGGGPSTASTVARRPGLLGRPGKQVLDPVAIVARDENKRRSMLHDRPTPT